MNQLQRQGYKSTAEKLANELRAEGYLSTDIVAVAYHLLEGNLDKAEKMEAKTKEVTDLINKAESFLKTI